mmetsp:Transcript_35670/g.113641  ORF Transcript_35670/g.113641 Transcript_35670/m.113641 type:complete len:239 (-) Transcript_35670:3162-3878(-)
MTHISPYTAVGIAQRDSAEATVYQRHHLHRRCLVAVCTPSPVASAAWGCVWLRCSRITAPPVSSLRLAADVWRATGRVSTLGCRSCKARPAALSLLPATLAHDARPSRWLESLWRRPEASPCAMYFMQLACLQMRCFDHRHVEVWARCSCLRLKVAGTRMSPWRPRARKACFSSRLSPLPWAMLVKPIMLQRTRALMALPSAECQVALWREPCSCRWLLRPAWVPLPWVRISRHTTAH